MKRISKASVRVIVARVIRDQRLSKAAMTAKGLSISQRNRIPSASRT